MKTFNLPDLGEGLAESEIVKWHISVGDMVKLDQVVLTVETAKATVDVPAPYGGGRSYYFGGCSNYLARGQGRTHGRAG